MSVKNYRFVSPGVFVNEIDNSQVPASPAGIGPVVIGRAASGPALRPVTVNSFEEFVNIFGTPAPGAAGGDVWREGTNKSSTTYGMYAAQAYLRNSSPLTYIRLLGANHEDADASAAENAGWSAAGDAWGLVVFESGSGAAQVSGALAAIFYGTEDSTFQLQGSILTGSTMVATGDEVTATDAIIGAVGANKEFKLVIGNYSGSSDLTASFNFTKTDSRYIRKVFNTNPQLTNSSTTDASVRVKYFLGETFDRHLSANITSSTAAKTFAAIVKLEESTGDGLEGGSFKAPLQSAQTPAIIGCRLSPSDDPINLFHFEALEQPGDWTNRNIKISIQDIRRSTNDSTDFGTFSVVVRHLSDSDNVVRIIEQYNNCDLNPQSLNYVARKIGTQQRVWDTDSRRLKLEGDWPNNSSHIRIVMNSAVDKGSTNAALLPFGFKGIVKYIDESNDAAGECNWAVSSSVPAGSATGTGVFYTTGSTQVTSSVVYPVPELRVSASDGGLSNRTDAYFGFQTAASAGSTVFANSTIDMLRPRGGIVGSMFAASAGNSTDLSQDFTLDDISSSAGVWSADSYADSSLTYVNGAVSGVLDQGYDRFTVPMYGGFDGVDIMDMDAFANINIQGTEETSYTLNTLRRSIDTIADPEVVEMSLATIPGLTHEGLTTHLINTCEDRADALAIIDLPDAFQPREEGEEVLRLNNSSTITTLINGLRSRGLNSSYGCTYYPWVRARDTINGAFLWLPPTVPALGTLSSSQRKTQVWFAPAGFNRGGLTEGSAGIPVVDVAHQLRRKDRDDLYAANINPIAKFPAEGIVIFGQKTLQVTPSALDRINVRRLMIFVKKRISQIASRLLFDPNVKQTWLRFLAQVNPFLADVKTNFGLSDFKVVLDSTTTTPDLIDRNILYAQIFLKPTRAIEFIAIDFNISRTGASFED